MYKLVSNACACFKSEQSRTCRPFSDKEKDDLQFLYDEWAHPFFISKEEFVRLMDGTGHLDGSTSEDWCEQTLPSWRQSIWVGVESPWKVISKFNPFIWYKVIREIVTLERMHQAFDSGLMEYGECPIRHETHACSWTCSLHACRVMPLERTQERCAGMMKATKLPEGKGAKIFQTVASKTSS